MSAKKTKIFSNPIFFGAIAAFLVVIAAPLFKMSPPQAYGICIVCHPKDFLYWIISNIDQIEPINSFIGIHAPLLTTFGIIAGSYVSSIQDKEFRLIKAENLFLMFIYGFVIAIIGLIILACPTRLVLRFAFGDPFALLGIFGLLIGIGLGVIIIKGKARN